MLFNVVLVSSMLAIVQAMPQFIDPIYCLKPGQIATARWNARGMSCTWTGIVGSNFGVNNVNGGEYGCNGRCGQGCNGIPSWNAYTQDCFNHDICSWFENASGGESDPNCGDAFYDAIDDTGVGGLFCGVDNPSYSPARPSTRPVCV